MKMNTPREVLMQEIADLKDLRKTKEASLKAVNDMITLREQKLAQLKLTLEEELEEIEGRCRKLKYQYCEEKGIVFATAVTSELELISGVAECHPDDEFDLAAGKVVALKRAFGIPFSPSKYGVEREDLKSCDNCKHEDEFFLCEPCVNCDGNICWERKVK